MSMKLYLCLFVFICGFFSFSAMAETVMDRIDKTQTLRCGYVQYHPAVYTDLKTNELKGYMVDITEEMGKRLALKIDWAHETNWPVLAADAQAGKFDVACSGYWSNPRIAKQLTSSIPVIYQPVFFFARTNDVRFDQSLEKINDPSIKISVLDGDVPETIARELYPKATLLSLPQTASFAQVFQDVATKRADVTIAALPDARNFITHNPNVLKQIKTAPVRVYPSAMMMDNGSLEVKHMVDAALLEMQLDGTIERLITPYMQDPDDFYFVSHPYTVRTQTQKTE